MRWLALMLCLCASVARAETLSDYLERSKNEQGEVLDALRKELFTAEEDLKAGNNSSFDSPAQKRAYLKEHTAKRDEIAARLKVAEKATYYAKIPYRVEVGSIGVIRGPVMAVSFKEEGVILHWKTTKHSVSPNGVRTVQDWEHRFMLGDKSGWRRGLSRELPAIPYRVTDAGLHDGAQVWYIEPVPEKELKAN